MEAEKIINSIVDSIQLDERSSLKFAGKTKAEVVEILWKGMNTFDSGKRTGFALRVADYIIDSIVLENSLTNDDNKDSIFIVNAIKPYLHSFDLSRIKDEIKYRHGHGGAYALWGARKGERGQSADQIAQELESKGIHLKSNNEADMFFEIIDMYSDAVRTLKEQGKKPKFNESLTDEDLSAMRNQIKMDILKAFDKKGRVC